MFNVILSGTRVEEFKASCDKEYQQVKDNGKIVFNSSIELVRIIGVTSFSGYLLLMNDMLGEWKYKEREAIRIKKISRLDGVENQKVKDHHHNVKPERLNIAGSSAGNYFVGQETRFGDQRGERADQLGVHG
jgi:hypothetical protein